MCTEGVAIDATPETSLSNSMVMEVVCRASLCFFLFLTNIQKKKTYVITLLHHRIACILWYVLIIYPIISDISYEYKITINTDMKHEIDSILHVK